MSKGRISRGVAAKCLLFVWLIYSISAMAIVFEPREFANTQQEARYKQLTSELRCLVCQNQNIADSDAPLAQDLRREVFRMLNEDRSDEQILDYMVQRYGDFVLYRPPVNSRTIALWLGPAVLAVFGLLLLWLTMKRKSAASIERVPLSKTDRDQLQTLLKDDPS
jgi:cytochrome c-type biogenesis protein CcmH